MSHLTLKRVLIKLSGESLSTDGFGIQVSAVQGIVNDIKEALSSGVQLAIVIGGGNILRGGRANFQNQIERSTADTMGMLATMINALALSDILTHAGIDNEVLSSRGIDGVLECTNPKRAKCYLNEGKVVIFAGGTGNPFVTTDSTATLRAIEIDADAILKVTTVDGVYDKDPNKHDDAVKFDSLSFNETLKRELAVMDLGSFVQARDFNVPICVFNVNNSGALLRVLQGKREGTWVRD
ncbi:MULTISPECIES: UMP kinase [Cysteiniphilum]|uniref:Uridylate kinase n=1 Tax=Cysteiniphilum litorale TaxID=2056700 RepID=A0A8J2Z2N6_9GAMM|nr:MULTISPECIES: UMP kinase [Cysteiniphilum]GGF90628.1 uridylate kinase [Cysteiniphilum litorale]